MNDFAKYTLRSDCEAIKLTYDNWDETLAFAKKYNKDISPYLMSDRNDVACWCETTGDYRDKWMIGQWAVAVPVGCWTNGAIAVEVELFDDSDFLKIFKPVGVSFLVEGEQK